MYWPGMPRNARSWWSRPKVGWPTWAAERAAALLARPVGELRTVVAHLGSGCSVTAVDGGRSVATSIGLTPLEGLMMGTRAGSIDPGALFYLLRTGRLDPDELAEQMDHESGLLGVSGQTSDVRELVRLEASGDGPATLALAMFARRPAECIAASVTALPALDAIVFTGGIGENAAGLALGSWPISGRSASLRFPPMEPGRMPSCRLREAPGGTPDRGPRRPDRLAFRCPRGRGERDAVGRARLLTALPRAAQTLAPAPAEPRPAETAKEAARRSRSRHRTGLAAPVEPGRPGRPAGPRRRSA